MGGLYIRTFLQDISVRDTVSKETKNCLTLGPWKPRKLPRQVEASLTRCGMSPDFRRDGEASLASQMVNPVVPPDSSQENFLSKKRRHLALLPTLFFDYAITSSFGHLHPPALSCECLVCQIYLSSIWKNLKHLGEKTSLPLTNAFHLSEGAGAAGEMWAARWKLWKTLLNVKAPFRRVNDLSL